MPTTTTIKMVRSTIKSKKLSNPFTPVRKLFLKLDRFLKPSLVLGKRQREEDPAEYSDPIVHTPPESVPDSSPLPADSSYTSDHGPLSPERVALQNEDRVEDAIIITALDTVPFCCHEDLITMSRGQLVQVASEINAKLPAVMRIDVTHRRPDSFIRNSIEMTVGIRSNDAPPAPKADRRLSEDGLGMSTGALSNHLGIGLTPPSSPLARCGRPSDFYPSLTPRLARLVEEDEEVAMAMVVDRPMKRRRVSEESDHTIGEPTMIKVDEDMDADMDFAFTSTPLPRPYRSRSLHVAHGSPTPKRVLRSHSTKLPDEMKRMKIDTTFVTTTRPKYRYKNNREKGNPRKDQPIRTSTPRKLKPRHPSGYRPELGSVRDNSASNSMTTDVVSPASSIGKSVRVAETGGKKSVMGEVDMNASLSDMDISV